MCRDVVEDLASCVALCNPAEQEPCRTLLQCCEALATQLADAPEAAQQAVVAVMLPAVAGVVFQMPDCETRWIGLKVMCDAMTLAAQAIESGAATLSHAAGECGRVVVPKLGLLLEEKDPAVGIKLANAVLQCNPALITEVRPLVPHFINFFDLQSPCNNKVLLCTWTVHSCLGVVAAQPEDSAAARGLGRCGADSRTDRARRGEQISYCVAVCVHEPS